LLLKVRVLHQKGWTALFFAIYYGYLRVAALLLSYNNADTFTSDAVRCLLMNILTSDFEFTACI
jgi:ankyrin repeat protein